MIDKLPYTLTEGVVATQEGLVFELWKNNAIALFIDRHRLELTYEYVNGDILHRRISWADAAERLRYREGEPWCAAQSVPELACGVEWLSDWNDLPRLHRLAAILCDDAEGFRILHTCIERRKENDDVLTPEQEKEKWRKIVVAAHYLSENGEVKKKALANAVGVTPRDMTFLLEPMAQAGVLVYERAAYVGALNAECWLDENEQDEEVRRVREKKTT